ncbi:MAG TPA: site-specific integrase [Candidatus Cybelea sp.]|jgi:hypothetical protein|nr:site-specific integrase [Candidatus Cybelea sp.]
MERGSLSPATAASYATDVARFMRWLKTRKLAAVDSSVVAEFLSDLKPVGRGRMLAALSEFFAFAFEKRLTDKDPLRSLKYRRSPRAGEGQLNFFALLTSQHVPRPKEIIWADFVEPLLKQERLRLRVGKKTVRVSRQAWRHLEQQFRTLVSTNDLTALLKKRIA